MLRLSILLAALALPATAHDGAQGLVKARMEMMKSIGDATKTLGQMAKSGDMDRTQAMTAIAILTEKARMTPVMFETRDLTKPTEALPGIWDNFEDFTRQSMALETAATALSDQLSDISAFRAGFARVGKSCQSCHEAYRLKK